MEYTTGSIGRAFVVRFSDGDDPLSGLVELAKKEEIRSALLFFFGGLKGGQFVVGPKEETIPPEPLWMKLTESHEVLGVGSIFWEEGTPKIHFHGTYAKRDDVKAGCLRKDAEVFLVAEAFVLELIGVKAVRAFDQQSGLSLLSIKR